MELSLPEWLVKLWSAHEREIWLLGAASAVMLVVSVVLIMALIVALPADYYVENNGRRRLFEDHPPLRFAFLLVKNAVGVVLLVAGLLMLVLPGQGILTILAALAALNFPGKRRLELAILQRPGVLRSVNWLRDKAGRRPLEF